jgi:SAM-dependent methyltransferase
MKTGQAGNQSHYKVHRRAYLWRAGGLALSLLLIIVAAAAGRPAILAAAGVMAIVFAILAIIAFSSGSPANNPYDTQLAELLYKLSQTRPSDNVAVVDLGIRWPAITISRYLTSGRMAVVDVYNPQLMPAQSLVRTRQLAPSGLNDPRIIWYDSNLNMLPLPDETVKAVFLFFVLSEMAQLGDRMALLKEIRRILVPDGRLLMAELADTWLNRLRPGSGTGRVKAFDYWTNLLAEAGFETKRSQALNGVTICLRADRPTHYVGQQLALQLGYEDS